MNFVKKLLVVLVVFAFFAAFLISQGKWQSAVVTPVAEVFGGTTAQNVDTFGQRSNDVTGKVLDLGGKMLDGYFSDTGVANPTEVKKVLAAAPPIDTSRIPDYQRAAFGAPWADVDGNNCSTRDDVLARDLTQVTLKDGVCTVLTGKLQDPYTDTNVDFTRGVETSSAVQIDHIFSLSAAWKGGASAWTDAQRLAFANDPEELLAVSGPANDDKSDKTPADWLPQNKNYICTYIGKYVYIAGKYNLAIDDRDREVITTKLNESC